MYYTVKLTKNNLHQEFVQWLTATAKRKLEQDLAKQTVKEPGLSWTVELTKAPS